MAPCILKEDVQSGLKRFGLHLRNMRLIGGDTVITAPLLSLFGFFLLHGLQDVPWITIAGLYLAGLLLTATIFGLNNLADAEIDARDPLKQARDINLIRDYESDYKHGIGTTAVRLGVLAVWWLRLGLLLAATGLILFAGWRGAFRLVPALLVPVILVLEILAIFRPGYYLPTQRFLFSLSYAAGGAAFVLSSG